MKRILIFLSLVFSDQLLKHFAQKLTVASGFLEYVCNKNIAWSISIAPDVFYFVWIAVFLFLAFLFLKSRTDFEKMSLILILSGAFSNLLDRFLHGCVVDFIDLKIWPVFNLADIFIAIGAVSLSVIYIKHKKSAEGETR